jgi:hypothetical protein
MKNILAGLALCLSLLTCSPKLHAQDRWAPLQFLVGTWNGGGKAEDATGKGTTAFTWEVGHQVLVRRDRTEFAATAKEPAWTYEALMVIYQNPSSGEIEANYFDSGKHVIHYKLAAPDKPNAVQFVSDAAAGPTFRLCYGIAANSDLTITFEMKAPGSATFQTVASGVAHKQ